MSRPVASRLSPAVVAVALALCLAGCSDTAASGPPEQAAHTVQAGDDTGVHGAVRVGLFEWSIVTAPRRVHPGRVTMVVTNTGGTEHDLVVQGRDGRWETPTLEPGDQVTMTVHAEPGETLHLWCAEPGHRAQGMHTLLRVDSAS